MKIGFHRKQLAEIVKRLGLRMPQVQLLLAQERYLERLVLVDHKRSLIWKGGSLLLRRYSSIQPPRFTTDLDLLVRGTTISDALELIKKATDQNIDDGFSFSFVKITPMKRDTPYGGERIELAWNFENKSNSEPLRIDLCAGDDVDSVNIKLDELFLEHPLQTSLSIEVYPSEFIFAEKLETLVRFGTGNTRLKDFIDLWTLAQNKLDSKKLSSAIIRCFKRRDSKLNPSYWEEVLSDKELSVILEEARKRNYPSLNIPSVDKIFKELAEFLRRIL